MCGIVGYISKSLNFDREKQHISWALSDMKYRGPDDTKIWSDKTNYITGFNRLSIRDLSKSAGQPMVSKCNGYVLSFNGEIYNSDFYKNILLSRGIKFYTTSDTEVLMNALIHLGIEEVLEGFDGIFAFAFYNVKRKTLNIARDRAGIKPLYYGYSQNGLIFSSQYNHIINHPSFVSNSFDVGAIGSFLQFGYMIEGGNSIIQNTSFLPHGNYLTSDGSSLKMVPFWNFPKRASPKTNTKLSDIIALSTNSQLISDVPVGTFMSGGNDSTLVTGFASTFKKGIKTFNVSSENKEYDESRDAKLYSDIFNTNHKSKTISKNDISEFLNINFNSFSEPFADFSSLPTLFLSEFVKKDVTVALSGDGGDELFWGYQEILSFQVE